MYFFFPEKIAGISSNEFSKWIIFDIEGLEPQEIKNNQYSLSNIITQYDCVNWQLQLKYKELILFESAIHTMYFEETLVKDVTITIDDLSVLNQLKLQYEKLLRQGNADIDNLIKRIEDLEKEINSAERQRENAEQNRVTAENERNQKFAELVKEMNNTILRLSHSIEEYNQNAKTQLSRLESTANIGVSDINSAKSSALSSISSAENIALEDINNEKNNVIEAIGNEVNQRITEFDNHVIDKTTEFNENYQNKIDELNSQETIERISNLEKEKVYQNKVIKALTNSNDTESVEDDNITIKDCLGVTFKNIEITGKEIKQETREGYNKFKNFSYNNDSITDSGITVTLQKNGKILVNGTATANVWFEILCDFKIGTSIKDTIIIPLDSLKMYTFIMRKVTGTNSKSIASYIQGTTNSTVGSCSITPSNNGNYKNFTEANGLYRSWIYISDESVFNNLEFELMVLEGEYTLENVPSYEKFGQSPSIDYPSSLEYVEGNQEVFHINENLFNENNTTKGIAINSDGIEIATSTFRISEFIIVNNFVNYSLSFLPYVGENQTTRVHFYDENKNWLSQVAIVRSSQTKRVSLNLEPPQNCKYIRVSIYNGFLDVMVAKESKNTQYIENQSETIILNNLPPLYSENDYIYYDENLKKYFVHNEYNKVILDGTQSYIFPSGWFSAKINGVYLQDIKKAKVPANWGIIGNVYCNRLTAISQADIQQRNMSGISIGENGDVNLKFDDSDNAQTKWTTETINQFLQENETEIIYELETPTDKGITDTVLIEQLDKLRSMFLYKGINNFIATSENGISANLKVEVYKDSIKIMKEQINEILANMNNTTDVVQEDEEE